ncbi:hypothetical protein HHK36_002913 [Tetracentron sinense]|uniref:DUF4283 domain-containing protein n=1 Tax=Tetracentron sinense TaxID=13715 RepID=A0A834ZRD5_TETSI|nr:hypothetical protein HHK36_002913 [Tetracentron sinense]
MGLQFYHSKGIYMVKTKVDGSNDHDHRKLSEMSLCKMTLDVEMKALPVPSNSVSSTVPSTLQRFGYLRFSDLKEIESPIESGAYGREVHDPPLNWNAATSTIVKGWRLRYNVQVVDLPDDILFKFEDEQDMQSVLQNEPWAFSGHHLQLQKWSPHCTPAEIQFTHTPWWIQLHCLPPALLFHRTGHQLREELRTILEVDTQGGEILRGKFLRLRILLDTWKPLRCGILGHEDQNCSTHLEGIDQALLNSFGPWLRADNALSRCSLASGSGRGVRSRTLSGPPVGSSLGLGPPPRLNSASLGVQLAIPTKPRGAVVEVGDEPEPCPENRVVTVGMPLESSNTPFLHSSHKLSLLSPSLGPTSLRPSLMPSTHSFSSSPQGELYYSLPPSFAFNSLNAEQASLLDSLAPSSLVETPLLPILEGALTEESFPTLTRKRILPPSNCSSQSLDFSKRSKNCPLETLSPVSPSLFLEGTRGLCLDGGSFSLGWAPGASSSSSAGHRRFTSSSSQDHNSVVVLERSSKTKAVRHFREGVSHHLQSRSFKVSESAIQAHSSVSVDHSVNIETQGEGGLGFRKMEAMNIALLAKQFWHLLQNQSLVTPSLWYRVAKAKYFRHKVLQQVVSKPSDSWGWKSILSAHALIKDELAWDIGNGEQVNIWGDSWIPGINPDVLQTFQGQQSDLVTVSHLLATPTSWNIALIRSLFPSQVAHQIASIPLPLHAAYDRPFWKWTPKGSFSVRSAYRCLMSGQVEGPVSSPSSQPNPLMGFMHLQDDGVRLLSQQVSSSPPPSQLPLLDSRVFRGGVVFQVDGAVNHALHCVAAGCIGMDSNLRTVGGASFCGAGSSPLVAEILAIRLGVLLAIRSSFASDLDGNLKSINKLNVNELRLDLVGTRNGGTPPRAHAAELYFAGVTRHETILMNELYRASSFHDLGLHDGPEDEHQMDVDTATFAIQAPEHSFPGLRFTAKTCSSASIVRLKNLNRRTIDVLASRLYFYYSYSYELKGPSNLLALHWIATLRHDELGQAVRIGDLKLFRTVAEKFAGTFTSDRTHNLIVRLQHNVIRTDNKSIVDKAIRDGAIEATMDHANGIAFCLNLHNEAVPALRFPPNSHKEKESVERGISRSKSLQSILLRMMSSD